MYVIIPIRAQAAIVTMTVTALHSTQRDKKKGNTDAVESAYFQWQGAVMECRFEVHSTCPYGQARTVRPLGSKDPSVVCGVLHLTSAKWSGVGLEGKIEIIPR